MTPYIHQEELAEQGYQLLKKHMICYLAMEERTGKTIIALLMAEQANVTKVLIVTKKGKPLDGWQETLDQCKWLTKKYTLINYHRVKQLGKADYDLIILDEAHNYISGYPKISKLWQDIKRFTRNKPIIYISATPYAQTPALLYHQFALSTWSPWKQYSTYYNWWKTYGTGETQWLNGRQVKCYSKVKDADVLLTCKDLFITKTRKELGFEHEPTDSIHYINLDDSTKELYNKLVKTKVLLEPIEFIADATILLRVGLHQLEGGTLKNTTFNIQYEVFPEAQLVKNRQEKIKDEDGTFVGYKQHNYYVLNNMEKIQHILDVWGDNDSIAIMYNYIGEGYKLRSYFKNAHILQATTNAEGVDLQHIDHLIIYSQDFSTARHTQRRARQANKNRKTPIIVHYLLVKGGISEQIYNTVTVNKTNYIDSLYFKEELK